MQAGSRGFKPRMRYILHGFVRVVKETDLRPVGSHRVGSIPTTRTARMSEWLKEADSRPAGSHRMGSNPISCTAVVAQW